MTQVKFYSGTLSSYNACTKDANALYFITDTLQMFKGPDLYSKSYQVLSNYSSRPEIGTPGVLYIFRDTNQLSIYESGAWEDLTPPTDTTPTKNSENYITSGGVESAIAAVVAVNATQDTTINGINTRLVTVEATVGTGGTGEGSFGTRLTAAETDITTLKTEVGTQATEGAAATGLYLDVANLNSNKLDKSGGTMTGPIVLSGAPTTDLQASTKKYVDDTVSTQVTALIGGAPAAYDTLKEVADWIATDTTGTAALTTSVANKVDKVDGKGLSTNDFTTAEKTKLAGITAGAEVNTIDTVKVNGTALTPDGTKAVNILVAGGTTNGTIKVNGVDVAVTGLGTAAYTAATAYATAAQGTKANSALQEANITEGTSNYCITVGTKQVLVHGLGTLAAKDTDYVIPATKLGSLGSYATITAYADGVAAAAKSEAISNTTSQISDALSWTGIT